MEENNEKVVLVAEDDPVFLRLISASLKRRKFRVLEAQNGLIAKNIFDEKNNKIDLIISDLTMPEMDGIAFLKHVKANSKTPFIVMTGFSELLKSKSSFKMGADEFIPKPFTSKALQDAIDHCLNPNGEAEEQIEHLATEVSYCAVPIDDFLLSESLVSDIYVRLAGTKLVRVARAGEPVPTARFASYREKGMLSIHVPRADFGFYVDFKTSASAVEPRQKNSELERRLLWTKRAEAVVQNHCVPMRSCPPASATLFTSTRVTFENFLSLLSDDEDTFNLLTDFEAARPELYARSIVTAMISCMVARQHGWTNITMLFKITLGALFHDIGLKEIDIEIVRKRRFLRTADEIALFESHVQRGREMISWFKNIPEEVGVIIAQHHESPNGGGYPLHLRADYISPFASLVGTVDRFVDRLLPLEEGQSAELPLVALQSLAKTSQDDVSPTFMHHLSTIFEDTSSVKTA